MDDDGEISVRCRKLHVRMQVRLRCEGEQRYESTMRE